ncbi:hypothetical protein BD410DRAFT_84897 [Rickenella mellea]|uniref:F-box domain-containing protein n=1 Tax=Rickenella mellea TaxID=50990 RepID=A0A4Y7PLT9_9AGAM|nr:hypothetical protein BD410DRAFT_84897 [Rickenella mellea]
MFMCTMPLLKSIQGQTWSCTPDIPYLSQLTSVHLQFMRDSLDIPGLSKTLHALENMQDLSLELDNCLLFTVDTRNRYTASKSPRLHSFKIKTLEVSLLGNTSDAVVRLLYDALEYLAPSTVDISLKTSSNRVLLYNSNLHSFPYGSSIRLDIGQTCNILLILKDVLQYCSILHSIRIEAPLAFADGGCVPPEGSSLRHLRFENCDSILEKDVAFFVKEFLSPDSEIGLRSLEFVSCKRISEDFLLEMQDEVGNGLKWTL